MLTAALRHAAVVNLALLDACILDMDRVATSTFRHDLTESRTVLEHAPSATMVQMVERRVALGTQAYLCTRAEMIEAREQELEETVALLADAVMQFRQSNSSFSEAEHLDRLFAAIRQSAEDGAMPASRTGRMQAPAETGGALGSQIADPAITISAGLAGARPGDTVDALIGRADRALYAAKAAGRNRIVVDSAA